MPKAQKMLDISQCFTNVAAVKLCSLDEAGLLLKIAICAVENGFSVFRMGNDPLSESDIAKLSSVTEAELKASLNHLASRGLISKESDGAFSFPGLSAVARRSEINKINGKKGGRPKAGKELNQNASEPSKVGSTAKLSFSNNINIITATADEVENLTLEILKETGLDRASAFAENTISRWLGLGYKPDKILQVIRDRRPAKPVKRLAWWNEAMKQAHGVDHAK
ncbi:hypothetical protein [Acidocella facilis]|uniref:hypothetical protein n=1 Tax=Acidocella facilis TaxID=525 RepID=UPI001F180312|nr:hypothetical protein [Acidocella facilis]